MASIKETVDWFASRDEDSYRDEARNILESYAHPWDVLVELAQNAVDAIQQARDQNIKDGTGTIKVTISAKDRSVSFFDDGIGIGDEDLKKVLKPHFSGKRGKSLRGEKGVGLTYIALVGNAFRITTKSNGIVRMLAVNGAQDWLGKRGARPSIEIESNVGDSHPDLPSYTEVSVGNIPTQIVDEEDLDIFTLNLLQMDYLLRSRTAIGYTGPLFKIEWNNGKEDVDVSLTIVNEAGVVSSQEIPFRYASPADYLPPKSLIHIDDVKKYLSELQEKKDFRQANLLFAGIYDQGW